ncbi:tyrosine-protein kinase CSK-like [Arctopsyche grandis]|uniref:tyrosine-protein kinase CSK-like n=1 Tax=Arctopsyche grandis TaxID=121162 RepID=UPI00406D9F63
MSSHNLQNSAITQHMSILGGGAGCWFTPSTPHQIPPTAPLRQKRQPTPNNQNSNTSNCSNIPLHSASPMSTSDQGVMVLNSLYQQSQVGNTSSMATSLQSMPGLSQHHSAVLTHHQQIPNITGGNAISLMQQTGLPDIISIQQGLPQPLRSAKPELRLCNMPWHHGKITRDRAEQLLQPRTDGLFLVRESTNFPGDQTLCVCFQNRVEHYRIKCAPNSTLTIDDEEFFDTLPQLIDHYLQDADGLCTQLVKSLPKQPPLPPANLMNSTSIQSQINIAQQTTNVAQMLQQKNLQSQTAQQCQIQLQALQQSQVHQQPAHPPQLSQPQGQSNQPNQIMPNDHNSASSFLAPQAFVDNGWVISERDLEIRENIGKGEFGDVMLGILNGQRVAVKMLKDSEAANKFLAEASLMTSLKHDNLVRLLGLVFNKQHICLVTEYMSKGSLVDYLRSRGRLHVTKRDQIMFAFDTCSGMEYLETRRVVHRDLAARNVLVSDTRRAKVADFGLAREEGGPDAAAKLPIKWTAPEALKHNKFSNKSDMWSFGILLWEIYSFGRVPYPRIPLADVVKHVEKGYKMEAPEGCPPELYDLMRQAWDLNPDTRPTFSQAKSKLAQLKASTPAQ